MSAIAMVLAAAKRRTAPEPRRNIVADRVVSRAAWEAASAGARFEGRRDADDTLVQFFDYQCPSCAAIHAVIESIRAHQEGHLRVVLRHFPILNVHRNALAAAIAAECAADQVDFKQMHTTLLRFHDSVGVAPWTWFAQMAGVTDLAPFRRCFSERPDMETVLKDRELALSIGLSGTPSILVNGVLLGRPTAESVRRLLRYRRRD